MGTPKNEDDLRTFSGRLSIGSAARLGGDYLTNENGSIPAGKNLILSVASCGNGTTITFEGRRLNDDKIAVIQNIQCSKA